MYLKKQMTILKKYLFNFQHIYITKIKPIFIFKTYSEVRKVAKHIFLIEF